MNKEKRKTDESAIEAALDQTKSVRTDETADAPGAAGDERFDALVETLRERMESGRVPEGFDLKRACMDATFLELTSELPMDAAMRVYAAETRASEAESRARAELEQTMQRRAALPRPTKGGAPASVRRDYASMSSKDFYALEQEYRRAAQRGIRTRL